MPNDLLVLLPHACRLHARGLFRGDVSILQEAWKGSCFSHFLLFMVLPGEKKERIPTRRTIREGKRRESRGTHPPPLYLQAEANTLNARTSLLFAIHGDY